MKLAAFNFLCCAAASKPVLGFVHDRADNALILGFGVLWFYVIAFSCCWLNDAIHAHLDRETIAQFRARNPEHR